MVEGAGKLFKLFESSLCLGIEEGVAGRRLGEHVIQLGHVGDDRLLVRFGGIDICTTTETHVRFFTPVFRSRNNYLWTCDLYGPEHKDFDAGGWITL
jgi:hypothetical protein